MQSALLHGEDNSRKDESEIDQPPELYVVELLEHLQAQVGTRGAGQRIGNEMSVKDAAPTNQGQSTQGQHLQNEDVGLVNRALSHLVPAAHAAPNGDERTRESR
jgi:hypothetical protein